MSDFFRSPVGGTPTFGFAPGVSGPRQNFLDQLTAGTSGGLTQGPTSLQTAGAKQLEGMLGTAPDFNVAPDPDSAIPFLQQMGPYAPYIQAVEQRIKQRLPEELAQVGEKYAGGYGGTSDWLRSLQETTTKGETDIAAALAPYILQAQGLGAQTALGSVAAGRYMQPTLTPEAESLERMLRTGTAVGTEQFGPSTGEQVLGAIGQLLPWLFGGGGGGGGLFGGGGGSSAGNILDFFTGAKNIPGLVDKISGLFGGGAAAGGLGPLTAGEWSNIVSGLGPISDVPDLMAGGFFPLAGSPGATGAASLFPTGMGIGEEAAGITGATAAGSAGGEFGAMTGLGAAGPFAALLAPLAAFFAGSAVTENKKAQREKAQQLANAAVGQQLEGGAGPATIAPWINQQYGEQWRYYDALQNQIAGMLFPGGMSSAQQQAFPGMGVKGGPVGGIVSSGGGFDWGEGGIPEWAGAHQMGDWLASLGNRMPSQTEFIDALKRYYMSAPDMSRQWQPDTGR